jgi:hypothetical protein
MKMLLLGEAGKLAPIFELFPRFQKEIEHLLQRHQGHIEEVAIDYDGDSIFCEVLIRYDGGEIDIDFFSQTQTLFVDFNGGNMFAKTGNCLY